ncbi:MAG: molybdopterin-dependent oxidoreductase [Gordonibacter sp.]
MSEESFVYTACPGWGDHEYCAIKTIVKDGKIIRTEPASYTGHEKNEGHICQKGVMSCRQPYNPERLTTPLKRAGERGEGKWEEISWDQALNEISEKLAEQRVKYGPESLSLWYITASYPSSLGLAGVLTTRFAGVYGAVMPMEAYGLDNGPLYASYFDLGNTWRYITTDPRNWDNSDYLIVWGANPVENQQRMARHIVEAKSRGAKVVDIGLLFDGTAGYADQFIPVKPASDPALGLFMVNYIISSDLHKKDFLLEHTVAPFLVRDDTNEFMRDGDGNYLVVDKTHGFVAVTPGVKEIPGATELEITGSYEVFGVPCKTAFMRLEEHVAPYTAEYQERITGVPAAIATQLAHEYATAENAFILGALGIRYQNQGEIYRTYYLLAALTGNLGHPGAGVTSELGPGGWTVMFNDAPMVAPNGFEDFKARPYRQADWYDQIENTDDPVCKALIIISGNPVHNCPNRQRWIERVLPKIELVVDFDIWITDTGEYADYILPDTQPFERYDLIYSAAYNHIVLQEPAIEPPAEVHDVTDLFTGLANRLGLEQFFDKTVEEWIEMRLATDDPLVANIEPPLTYKRLKEEKLVRMATPPIDWDPFFDMQFSTPSGRIEFYCERLVPVDSQLAKYKEPLEVPTVQSKADGKNEEYPYQFFSGRQRFFMQSMFTNDPVMRELSGGKPTARINPMDAEHEGIKDGDRVEAYNQRGHVIAICRLDEAIPPGTIQVWFGWRKKHFEEGMYSELLVPLGSYETIDDVAEFWWNDMVERGVAKCGIFTGSEATTAGAWDTIWDCACNIRKITDADDVEDGKDA